MFPGSEACAMPVNSSFDLLCASPTLCSRDALMLCDNFSARCAVRNAELFRKVSSPFAVANLVFPLGSCSASHDTQFIPEPHDADTFADNGSEIPPSFALDLRLPPLFSLLWLSPHQQKASKKNSEKARKQVKKRQIHTRNHKIIARARFVGHQRKSKHRRKHRLTKQPRYLNFLHSKQDVVPIPLWARPQVTVAPDLCFIVPVPCRSQKRKNTPKQPRTAANAASKTFQIQITARNLPGLLCSLVVRRDRTSPDEKEMMRMTLPVCMKKMMNSYS